MSRFFLFTLLFLIPTIASSYDLNGSVFNYDESDKTYTVVVQNNEGHEYIGKAEEKSDGSLIVSVSDAKGETYIGTAIPTEDGFFNLNLKNKATGNTANGELEED